MCVVLQEAPEGGVVKEEEYKGSNVFLKGTQSANPHNDYSQHFIDTGQRAQNFIRDVGVQEGGVWSRKGVWFKGICGVHAHIR